MKIEQKFKRLFLIKIPSTLPGKFQIPYWVILSWIQGKLSHQHYIKSITPFSSNKTLFLISMTDGDMLIPSLNRIPRFLRGRSHASNRIFRQYTDGILIHLGNQQAQKIIFDIGANVGEFSIAAREIYENALIYAIEPDPSAYECLKYNIKRAGYENFIIPIALAFSNESGIFPFYKSTANADSSLYRPKRIDEIINLECTRGDRFLSMNNLSKISLLKMDAEGFEPEVLQGFGKLLQNIEILLIDVGPERGGFETAKEISEILEAAHYKVWEFTGQGQRKFIKANKINVD